MTASNNADDAPTVHPRWGAFAEELLHHTSRYYAHAEAFLRHRGAVAGFTLVGYQADQLSERQRQLMAVLLCHPPTPVSCADIAALVEAVRSGTEAAPEALVQRYAAQLARSEHTPHACLDTEPHEPTLPPDTQPLDPFLAIADRLNLAVTVQEHRVEVSLVALAEHLDSPHPQMRTNLQDAILWLHEAGFRLHNHPHLTHEEANQCG